MITEAQIARAEAGFARLREAIAAVIVGQSRVVEVVLWGLLSGGHVSVSYTHLTLPTKA